MRDRPLFVTGHSYAGGRRVLWAAGVVGMQRKEAAGREGMQGVGRLHPVGRMCDVLHRCVGGRQLSWATILLPPPKAGHYIPLLAQAILDYNSGLPEGAQKLDLRGYAVGNAWTDPALDNQGAGAVRAWRELPALPRWEGWEGCERLGGSCISLVLCNLSRFGGRMATQRPRPVCGSLHRSTPCLSLTFSPPRLPRA